MLTGDLPGDGGRARPGGSGREVVGNGSDRTPVVSRDHPQRATHRMLHHRRLPAHLP